MSFWEIATAGGFTVIGALVGGWIGYKSAVKSIRITEFNKAASEFKAAFLPEIIYFKHNAVIKTMSHSDTIREKLMSAYIDRQLKGYELFKGHLTTRGRKGIKKAWDEYCHPKGIPKDPNEKRDFRFNDYMGIEEFQGTDKAKKIALEKINNLLEFANFR